MINFLRGYFFGTMNRRRSQKTVDNKLMLMVISKLLINKQNSTMKLIRSTTAKTMLAVAILLSAGFFVVPQVSADRFDEQIEAIKSEITGFQERANELASQADTLQRALDVITNEKNILQSQIDINQAKLAQLDAEIKDNEEKLERQKRTLNKTIVQIYANGDTSPIVMLASTKNVGEFVSAQAVRGSVRDQMNRAMEQVKVLKAKLAEQKVEVERVLADQTSRRQALQAKENEQATLVSQTRGEEAAYQSMISVKNSEIENLREQQRAANSRFIAGSGPACGGGYPGSSPSPFGGNWGCNYPLDHGVDDWGMYNRQCVSYVAFKVSASGRYMPYWGGRGDAHEWDDNAIASGIPVDQTPRPGSVAISNAGYYGHAMYVESVNADGTITVSQYNADWRGTYSVVTISPAGLNFIHFP